jgi:hypothetical protein
MRPNRYIILISILFGAFGAWFSADAVGQYLNTARSYAAVDAYYVEDSFAWEDPEHERARAEFVIVNDSDNDARLSYFGMNLMFDGQFAGARYEPWDPIDIPAGESATVEVPFLISISSLRPEGSDAELSVRGQLRLDFETVERDMSVPMSGTIGRVPYEESDS